MTLSTTKTLLTPRFPFDFKKSLAFLRGFPPARADDHSLEPNTLTKPVRVAGRTVVFEVSEVGSTDTPELNCTLYTEQPLDADIHEQVVDRARFFLSMDDDLESFYEIGRQDPCFLPIQKRLYGYHQVKFLTPFENACWAVLTQRAPMKVAGSMKKKLVNFCGKALKVDGELHQAFPAAADLAPVSIRRLRKLLGNRRKARRLRAVIEAFSSVEEDFLRGGDFDDVQEWLRNIRGIGSWSAAFVMLRGLGRMERLEGAEEHLLGVAARVYGSGKAFSMADFRRLAARYGPHQGYWMHYIKAQAAM